MCIQKHGRRGQLGCKHYTESVLVGGACATEPRQACPPDGAASSVCGSSVGVFVWSVRQERRQPPGMAPARGGTGVLQAPLRRRPCRLQAPLLPGTLRGCGEERG